MMAHANIRTLQTRPARMLFYVASARRRCVVLREPPASHRDWLSTPGRPPVPVAARVCLSHFQLGLPPSTGSPPSFSLSVVHARLPVISFVQAVCLGPQSWGLGNALQPGLFQLSGIAAQWVLPEPACLPTTFPFRSSVRPCHYAAIFHCLFSPCFTRPRLVHVLRPAGYPRSTFCCWSFFTIVGCRWGSRGNAMPGDWGGGGSSGPPGAVYRRLPGSFCLGRYPLVVHD